MEIEIRINRARYNAHQSNEFLMLIKGTYAMENAPTVFRRFNKAEEHEINLINSQIVEEAKSVDINLINTQVKKRELTVCDYQDLWNEFQMQTRLKLSLKYQEAYLNSICGKFPSVYYQYIMSYVIKNLVQAHKQSEILIKQNLQNTNKTKIKNVKGVELDLKNKENLPSEYNFIIQKYKHKYFLQSAKKFLEGQIIFAVRLIASYLDSLATKMILKNLKYYFCSDCMRQKRNVGFEIEEGVLFLISELYEILRENKYISFADICKTKNKKQYLYESQRGYLLFVNLEQNDEKFASQCVCDKPWIYRILCFFGCYDKVWT